VPWFFALCRRYGLRVSHRVSSAHGHWPQMIAGELRGARHARARRRAAMAEVPPSP
jgi:hypothetical protein